MRPRQFPGPKLPKELREQFGDSGRRSKGHRQHPTNRKDRRKAERQQKKQITKRNTSREDTFEESEDEASAFSDAESHSSLEEPTRLKSILKKTSLVELTPPPPVVSRAVKDRLEQDDAEIAALEKKLGARNKKGKKSNDDGLDDLLKDLGGSSSDEDEDITTLKRKRPEDDEWLTGKRKKALAKCDDALDDQEDSNTEDNMAEATDGDSELGSFLSDEFEQPDDRSESDTSNDDRDDQSPDEPVRIRENPYVAPVTADAAAAPQKYVPPSLRAPPSSDAEALTRLKRQMQGLLNRLSEANMLSILRDIEHIYQNHPRGYVNSTVIDLLIGLLADETVLLDTFLILHAGFIAAIYKVVGSDFGAQMVERIVVEFDKHYEKNKSGSGKQVTNLISLVAELYVFQVIGSNLVFDYLKFFLSELSEINTELLLRIVKVSGSQLRQDNPTSLKDIVLLLQTSVAATGESNLSVRTKFMVETINNLKNNRMKTGVGASAIVSEHTTRMKKHLGSLNTRNLKGTEPLRIGINDIRNTEKRGKWWLVGASWRDEGAQESMNRGSERPNEAGEASKQSWEEGDVDLLQLAREQRMNTDIRRAIFVTIMSAADYKDAYVKLLKLNLKRSQQTEVPRVVVRCAGSEKTYNPYYTFLAERLSSDHKTRKGFQFALWDVFKSLGEGNDGGSSDEEHGPGESSDDTSLRRLVNLGKLYGTLIAHGALSITALKPLDFPYLQPKTRTFVEILLVTVILQSQKGGQNKKSLLDTFIRADEAPEMIAGVQYFLQNTVRKSSITATKSEKEKVKWACKEVAAMLTRLMAVATLDE